MQSCQLNASAIEVVQYDLSIGGSSGYMRAELAMGPLHIMDGEALTLPGMGGMALCSIDYGGAQIGILDDLGIIDADGLEDLLASEDGVCAVAVDVEGGNVQACFMACILGQACMNAVGSMDSAWRKK